MVTTRACFAEETTNSHDRSRALRAASRGTQCPPSKRTSFSIDRHSIEHRVGPAQIPQISEGHDTSGTADVVP